MTGGYSQSNMLFFFFFLVYIPYNLSVFDASRLSSMPLVQDNATIDYLVSQNIIERMEWGCLRNCHQPHDSKNKWFPLEKESEEWKENAEKDEKFLRGTTFWVNEHMSVGHAMYDISIIQVLQSTKVDRIVLQRAPCMNVDLCAGIGTFDSFYKGFYMAMIDAFQPGIPVYIRWTWQEKTWKPIYVGSSDPDGYTDPAPELRLPDLKVSNEKCFERVIRKNTQCHTCFYPSLSVSAVVKFKEVAYSTVRKVPALTHHFSANNPITILHTYRGPKASRHMLNFNLMQTMLLEAFPTPKYNFITITSSDDRRSFHEQIQMVAEAQVVIAEHGAFQSNVMYMRNASLMVSLDGPYGHGEFANFRNLAQMFGVFYKPVLTRGLELHRNKEFNISMSEIQEVIDKIHVYLTEKPYAFNMRSK